MYYEHSSTAAIDISPLPEEAYSTAGCWGKDFDTQGLAVQTSTAAGLGGNDI
jgi:hypothetical protein